MHKYTYFLRTIPEIERYLKPLDDLITQSFLPTLLDAIVSDLDRNLYSLPTRKGGLGIPILREIANQHFESSLTITSPLVAIMITQGETIPPTETVNKITSDVKKRNEQRIDKNASQIESQLPPKMCRAITEGKQKGA